MIVFISGCLLPERPLDVRTGYGGRSGFESHFGGFYHDLAVQDYVQSVGMKLVGTADGVPDLPWQFRVLNDQRINAFALPGGLVYVTRGLLFRLDNEAELAAVLAQQIAHVAHRDAMRNLDQWQDIPPDATPEIPRARQQEVNHAALAANLPLLTFDDQQELNADITALNYLYHAGYPPRALVWMLEKMQSPPGGSGPDYLATHPLPPHQIPAMETLIVSRYPDSIQNGNTGKERFEQQVLSHRKDLASTRP